MFKDTGQKKGTKRIGLMGGTFDPIHHGHLVTAEEARCQFGMEKVIFIPAAMPPHKTRKGISHPQHRLEMTQSAVRTNSYFTVSDIEIKREGLSYTIDTVQEMREIYAGWELFFITGADAVLEILTWKNVIGLLEQCYFVAATRPGFKLESIGDKLDNLPENCLARIKTMEVPALAISSTEIRRRVREGRPIKYLLPEAVEEYIYQKRLYQG
ncbi:nicotinate-nucleotide adenylyltransferase [Desulfoscipio geothermicus]|uniref:Probable nicotinate-nucleotide adenylyltransferase n=1 Tax=Desulfoscipio geothermicus DSM 3669 TaxID=1121426 RepID=A0A1I6DSB7_9FIRM|nr:nicotinate-nucleotide adenylyltransferase [Desulfoscipio geothermicus]SFR08282.1 nicotinate-nucleotide adenylyltransferase [Desulfoscipio geothermicus DSM 3669]